MYYLIWETRWIFLANTPLRVRAHGQARLVKDEETDIRAESSIAKGVNGGCTSMTEGYPRECS